MNRKRQQVEAARQALKPLEEMSPDEAYAMVSQVVASGDRQVRTLVRARWRELMAKAPDWLEEQILRKLERMQVLGGHEELTPQEEAHLVSVPVLMVQADLLGSAATPAERLLARVAGVAYAQTVMADCQGNLTTDLATKAFFLKAGEVAHKRMMRTIQTLAMLRRLTSPQAMVAYAQDGDSVRAAAVIR